jgi:hypothetical protein
VASKALERLDIGVCRTRRLAQVLEIAKGRRHGAGGPKLKWRLTGKDVPLQVLVPGKGLATVGAENHLGSKDKSKAGQRGRLRTMNGSEGFRLYGRRLPDLAVGGGSWTRDRSEPHVNGEKVMSVVAASKRGWMWLGCRGLRRRQGGL